MPVKWQGHHKLLQQRSMSPHLRTNHVDRSLLTPAIEQSAQNFSHSPQPLRSQTNRSGLGGSFFQKLLTIKSNNSKQGDSNFKRAITEARSKSLSHMSTIRSKQSKANSRKDSRDSKSISSEELSRYKRHLMLKRKASHKDIKRSKDVFHELHLQNTEFGNENSAKLLIMDLDRISKNSTLRS